MKKIILISICFLCFRLIAFAQVNLSQGLVLYLPFNGNTIDASGNGNNAINSGATLTVGQAGNPNSAYQFNGISDFMKVANNSTINSFSNDSFTLYAIVKPQGFYTGACHGNCILDKNGDFNPGWYSLRYSDSYSSSFQNCNSPVNTTQENFTSHQYNLVPSGTGYTPYIALNNWYCITSISDGQTIKLFVNGILVMTQNLSGSNGINLADLFIGCSNNPSFPYWFNGVIDEIRIYNRAINSQEITALCNCGSFGISAVANPSTICTGQSTTLTASGASTYSWTGGVTNGVAFTPNVTNTYTVIGTDANGCTATSSVAIQVSNNLAINVSNTSPILCLNDVSTLTATGANSYSWLPSAGLNTANAATVLASPTISTTYTVVGTDANGCTGSVTTLVDIVQPINIVVSKSNDIECGKSSAQLLATGATNYFWTPSNLVSNPSSNITSTSIKKTTTFYVTGTKGTCTDIDSITVEFFNSDGGNTFIPTAFSPNGDNKNDCLNIKSSANFSTFYFAIYNRWGQRVFESDNINACWNGIYNGKEAIADTYYYYLKAKTSCGDILKKGDITLVR